MRPSRQEPCPSADSAISKPALSPLLPEHHSSLLHSGALLRDCAQLCHWAEEFHRAVKPDPAVFLAQVAYPDASPLLVLSEASLADLNTRLEKKVKMDNFRPNIVVTGCDAFEEVGGSPCLCVVLRCAVRDTNGTVSFSRHQLRPSRLAVGETVLPQGSP